MEECSKFGKVEVRREYQDHFSEMPPGFGVLRLLCVQAIEMPRLGTGKTKVYIKFDSLASAQKGHQNLHGRSFEARYESFPLAIFQLCLIICCCGFWQTCGGELLPGG